MLLSEECQEEYLVDFNIKKDVNKANRGDDRGVYKHRLDGYEDELLTKRHVNEVADNTTEDGRKFCNKEAERRYWEKEQTKALKDSGQESGYQVKQTYDRKWNDVEKEVLDIVKNELKKKE